MPDEAKPLIADKQATKAAERREIAACVRRPHHEHIRLGHSRSSAVSCTDKLGPDRVTLIPFR